MNGSKYDGYYSDLFYGLLPAIYRSRDSKQGTIFSHLESQITGQKEKEKDQKILKHFLDVIAQQAAVLRRDIDGLWADFFIDTCKPWVIPYIADLIGTNLILNDGAKNRADVKYTVEWRKRKGTPLGLEDVARFITGWNAKLVEFFSLISITQNLNILKIDQFQTPDLRNSLLLDRIYSYADTTSHNVDLRKPYQTYGWYNVKNIGFYFPRMQLFQISDGNSKKEPFGKSIFSFSPVSKSLQLYNKKTSRKLTAAEFKDNPYSFFGHDHGMSVKIHGILAADIKPERSDDNYYYNNYGDNDKESNPTNRQLGSRSTDNIDFLRFRNITEIELLEHRKFSNPRLYFEISILDWKSAQNIPDSEDLMGKINTLDKSFLSGEEDSGTGFTVIRISCLSGSESGMFPETAIRIVQNGPVRAANVLESWFKNTIYVWLPPVFLARSEEISLLVKEDGTTVYTNTGGKGKPKSGCYPDNDENSDRFKIARTSLGQIYPPKVLTYSNSNLDGFLKLNSSNGIRIADESRIPNGYIIAAYAMEKNKPPVRLGELHIGNSNEYMEISEHDQGLLVLSVEAMDSLLFPLLPMSEIILTNKKGQSRLIYLPEIQHWDIENDQLNQVRKIKYYLPAYDGSTFSVHPDDFQVMGEEHPSVVSGYSLNLIKPVRKSAGQILPMPGYLPLRFRIPVSYDSSQEIEQREQIKKGELGIDPSKGRFCFSDLEGNIDNSSLSVNFNYAFPAAIGAGPYDRRLLFFSIKDFINDFDVVNKKFILDSLLDQTPPTCLVTKRGDAEIHFDIAKRSNNINDDDNNHDVISNSATSSNNSTDENNIANKKIPIFESISEALKNLENETEIIEVVDSALYQETLVLPQSSPVKNLILRSSNGQRPVVILDETFSINIPLETLSIVGIYIKTLSDFPSIHLANKIESVSLISSTINPSNQCILRSFGDERSKSNVTNIVVYNSLVGSINTTTTNNNDENDEAVINLMIKNCVVDRKLRYAIYGNRVRAHMEHSTVFGKIKVDQLNSSESILSDIASVLNRQKGCFRYTRYQNEIFGFRWELVPGVDNNNLKKFIIEEFGLDWIKNATITSNGNNIKICSYLTHSLQLERDEEKSQVNLNIDGQMYSFGTLYKNGFTFVFEMSRLPTPYKCTDKKPIFNSIDPHNPNYAQLSTHCDKDILSGAENGSEMGVYYLNYFSLITSNFDIKLEEYMPLGIAHTTIMED